MKEDDAFVTRRMLVLDSSALVSNVRGFAGNADDEPLFGSLNEQHTELFCVPELFNEVRDASARKRLALVQSHMRVREPRKSSIRAVSDFAKQTGDYVSLSLVDLKVIALLYELEVEANGRSNIKDEPVTLNFRLPRSVDDRLPEETDSDDEDDQGDGAQAEEDEGWTVVQRKTTRKRNQRSKLGRNWQPIATAVVPQDEVRGRNAPSDATAEATFPVGMEERPNTGTTQRSNETQVSGQDAENNDHTAEIDTGRDKRSEDNNVPPPDEKEAAGSPDSVDGRDDAKLLPAEHEEKGDGDGHNTQEEDDGAGWISVDNLAEALERDLGMAQTRPSAERIVGCVTTDFAMQNVLMQMGLKLLSVDGQRVIKQVRQFIMRCTACMKFSRELEKVFCPHCGNYALRKLPFRVDEQGNAHVFFDPNRQYSTRGTKYSIPKPKGGRTNRDLILSEDQLYARRRQQPRRSKKTGDLLDPNTKFNAGARFMPNKNLVVGYGRKNPNAVVKKSKR